MIRGRGIGRHQVRHSGISIMSNDIVKLRRKPLVDRLTCPLCKNLYREATTISVCLHTYLGCHHIKTPHICIGLCGPCINQKLEEDETKCCPVCKADLGSSPKETLRPDNSLRHIVAQIFPLENSTRRVEISITSQVNNTVPEVTKPNAPKAKGAQKDAGTSQETVGKIHDDRCVEEKNNHLDKTPSPESSNSSSTASKKQISLEKELPRVSCTISEPMAHVDSFKEANKGHNQEPLAHHKEAEYRKIDLDKTPSNILVFDAKNKDTAQTKKKRNMNRRPRESLFMQRKRDEKIVTSNIIPEMPKDGRDSVERTIDPREQKNEQNLADGVSKILQSVWFCLLTCEDMTGNALPQIPKSYIRINNGDMPVSYINKYLVQKLNLNHESEVEIIYNGEPLNPSLTLNELVNIWIHFKSSSGPVFLSPGEGNSDRKNFVMELTYRRSSKNGAPIQN